jgi:excisionase family DNA binding protein
MTGGNRGSGSDLLSTADAAKILSLSADMVRLLARDGRLAVAARTVGGVRLFRRDDVEALLAERSGLGGATHRAQFYESDEFLCEVVASFLAEGLTAGAAVCAIATRSHRHGIAAGLERHRVRVRSAERSGRLTFIDAEQLLAELMPRGELDRRVFRDAGTSLLQRLATGRARPRLYGEMVDLLCRSGRPALAIELEKLWDGLGRKHSFSLLCGYSMASFDDAAQVRSFRKICGTHAIVAPTERFDRNDMRKAAELEQLARALDKEVVRRKRAERELRAAVARHERDEGEN